MPVVLPAAAVTPETADCPVCRAPLAASPTCRSVNSRVLLDGGRELLIRHHGSEYHLRLTRNDKLILTK